MCIAILSKKDILVPHKHLEASWERNDDGAGFMYAEGGKLTIRKGFMTFDKFMEAYEPHEAKDCVLHFRIATHGKMDEDNTHPFEVGEELGFVHNGIINNVDTDSNKDLSDTNHFNTQYLQELYQQDKNFIFKPIYNKLIASFIGASKLIFLNNEGQSTLVNGSYGIWDNGIWYSNTSYQPRQVNPHPHRPQVNRNTPVHTVFKQGTEVYVKHPRLRGRGTIQYFTGNNMVGVLMTGDKIPSLLPMQCLDVWREPRAMLHQVNQYKPNDYVMLKADTEMKLGIVRATNNHSCWVQWTDDRLIPIGQAVSIPASNLQYWD